MLNVVLNLFKVVIKGTMSPANIYLFKVNNRNTKRRCEICSKLTIKTPERLHFFSVSVADFGQVNVGWKDVR